MTRPSQTELLSKLEALRPALARAAQSVMDEWEQDEEGYDCELGTGGVCDRVSEAMAGVISEHIPDAGITDGGHEGDDHAWLIVYDDVSAYGVDIPPSVYETGGGYAWRKREDVAISPDDVAIFEVEIDRKHVVSSNRGPRSGGPRSGGPRSLGLYLGAGTATMGSPFQPVTILGLHEAAVRVASHSVEAAKRRRKPKAPARGRSSKRRKDRESDPPEELPSFEDDVLASATEYSCQVELSLTADFEGEIEKQKLIKKLKGELTAAIRAAMSIVARDFGLTSSGVQVRPVRVECSILGA